ncbi:phage terminase large subunit [Microvirga sp. CF3062]|uniref:phage terminase large subunit n=1 Tax=Microvirga sp. CF3062 TaxID=3110182 RepID=UPI002E788483|nr:phage terminase large subunit [Microvirga sp. CF3062]MEE1656744.1 phage terminase large subunit [Microvirga sp. CF3062]
MTDQARLLRALLRNDLSSFVQKVFALLQPVTVYLDNWHIRHICWQLQRVLRDEKRRLVINMPPRSMKSIIVSIAFVAWAMGHDPTRRIICVSYAEELARKLSIDTRTVLESAWFRALFPALQLTAKRQRNLELTTTLQGYRFASGVGGSVLGRGADLIVIDDPIKAIDALSEAGRRHVAEFYGNTLSTRLNDKQTGAIVIVMQRLHEDDLVGHVLAKEEWEVVSIPAIATETKAYQLSDDPDDVYIRPAGEVLHEEREPLDILEAIRRVQGSLLFAAQYQQNPVPADGNVIRRDWLRFYETAPSRFDRVIVSWDTASTLEETSDWSVGTVWGAVGLDYYLIDLVHGRFESPDLRRQIIALSARHNADATLIEDTELGRALEQDLRRSGELRALRMRPRFDKQARLLAQSARFEGGQVYLPREAPWLGDYIAELLAFPNGRHDDQVDSTSQALTYLTNRSLGTQDIVRRDPVRRDVVRRS